MFNVFDPYSSDPVWRQAVEASRKAQTSRLDSFDVWEDGEWFTQAAPSRTFGGWPIKTKPRCANDH